MLLTMKNRTEIAKYGSKAEIATFGDFKNFSFAKNYDQELSLRLSEKTKTNEKASYSEFTKFTNEVSYKVTGAIEDLFK